MDVPWLKIIMVAIVVVVGTMVIKGFLGSRSEPKPKAKSVYDVFDEDEKRLRAEPEFNEPAKTTPAVKQKQPTEPAKPLETVKPVEAAKPQFEELSEAEEIEAERLFNIAVQHRKIGRLPTTGYKVMVDICRELIEKFPGSVYAFKAKRMLVEVPPHMQKRYKITADEIDLGNLK